METINVNDIDNDAIIPFKGNPLLWTEELVTKKARNVYNSI
jgi:hypothetical protein